jgi:hypothetical protein
VGGVSGRPNAGKRREAILFLRPFKAMVKGILVYRTTAPFAGFRPNVGLGRSSTVGWGFLPIPRTRR